MASNHRRRTLDGLVRADDVLRDLKSFLAEKTRPLGIMFVDLCDSTELKERLPQTDWLPVVARFLKTVTKIVQDAGGTVVKYIGDEVMAVFPDDVGHLLAAKMETCVRECSTRLAELGPEYTAKYALDYGEATWVDLAPNVPRDVLGTPVDRCARIKKFLLPDTAVSSDAFVSVSPNSANWRKLGKVQLKGIRDSIVVHQLSALGASIPVLDKDATTSAEDLKARVGDLQRMLDNCRGVLKVLRSKKRA